MTEASGAAGARHAFVPCDAFSLLGARRCAEEYARASGGAPLDVLVMTQGIATTQGYTPTVSARLPARARLTCDRSRRASTRRWRCTTMGACPSS